MSLKISLNRNVRSIVEELRQSPLYFCTCHSQLSPQYRKSGSPSLGLFGSHELQIIPQLQACFMELRLAVAYRTPYDLCNFVMLEAFHIVQHKNRSIARR